MTKYFLKLYHKMPWSNFSNVHNTHVCFCIIRHIQLQKMKLSNTCGCILLAKASSAFLLYFGEV